MSLNEDWGDLDNENRPTSSASSTRPNQHLIISAADREPFRSTENLSDSDEVVSESDYQNSPEAKRYRKITVFLFYLIKRIFGIFSQKLMSMMKSLPDVHCAIAAPTPHFS